MITNIKRKAAYIIDADTEIGKAQFCYYFIKFYKNREVTKTINFIETKLSQLLNFETTANESGESDEDNVFIAIIKKIPTEWILKGKKLFEVISVVHAGLDAEVERVK